MPTEYTIASAADDGIVSYRGSNDAATPGTPTAGNPLWICIIYGDGSVYVGWDQTLHPTQASVLVEAKNASETVIWSFANNGTFNHVADDLVLAGTEGEGPLHFTVKIYEGAGQTGTLLATGTSETFDITGLDYIESTPTILSNIQIGYGTHDYLGDPDAIYAARCWMRFTSVAIPQGNTVTSAYIKLQSINHSTNYPYFTFSAEDVDNATTNPSSLTDYSARIRTTATVSPTISYTTGPWDPGVTYSFNITTIIQEIVNRPGWVSGNSIMIFWEPSYLLLGGTIYINPLYVEAADFPSISGPRLEVDFTAFVQGVGTSVCTSTATAVTQYGVIGRASGAAEAQAFSAAQRQAVGTAAGTGNADGVGLSENRAVGGAAAGVGNADGAVGLQGWGAVGTAAGTSTVNATGAPENRVAGTAAGTSTVIANSITTKQGTGSANVTYTASGVGSSNALSTGSSTSVGNATGVGLSENRAVGGAAAGVGNADGAVSLQGWDTVGTAAGTNNTTGVGLSESRVVGTAAGTSDATAIREVLAESTGSIAGSSTAFGGGAWGVYIVGTIISTSRVEGRSLSETQKFLNDLTDRIGRRSIGGNSTRFLELDGATIVEPTAFEPDPTTYRQSHYYNAITNTLYRKVTVRNEPGITVAHWQKVSN